MKVKDPNCGMDVDPEKTKFIFKKGKKVYYFCSEKCKKEFLEVKKTAQSMQDNPKDKHQHHDHHKMMMDDFKKRFIISLITSIPILIISPLIQNLFGYALDFAGSSIVLLILSGFVYFYGGWPFLKGIFRELKGKMPGMMTLIALAISVAFFYSAAVVFGLKGKFFFWELVTLIDVMLLGHWLEMRSILGASKALEKLSELLPDTAHLIKGSKISEIKVGELHTGDLVLVKPGEKVPADGVIMTGEGYVDESMLTGESRPVKKKKGAQLIAGSINGDASFEMKISKSKEESYLSKVIDLVRQAQESKSKTQRLADKAALWLTIVAITVGAGTLAAWIIFSGDIAFAIERMATVMVITCPHALGLAVPLVVSVSTALSAKNGLLIRNRTAFENSRKITTILFDKTGTLTEGTFAVEEIRSVSDKYNSQKILQLAASLERESEHPIGKGIIKKAEEQKVKLLKAAKFRSMKGEGITGIIGKKKVSVVSPKYLSKNKILIPKNMQSSKAATTVYVVENKMLLGSISLADKIRKESYGAIKRLQKSGIKCWMLTGDNKIIAEEVSKKLKLDGYFAEVLPHQKQEKIKELQKKKEFVAMTGDGVNDAPALAQADVGIAVGSGTDVAAETADIILVRSNPDDITSLILFGKATYRKMVQNLFWATGYNIVAIPLAAGVVPSLIISPAVGAALMSLSTIIVAINAKLLSPKKNKKKR